MQRTNGKTIGRRESLAAVGVLLRLAAYLGFSVLVLEAVTRAAAAGHAELVASENGPIELVQLALAALAAVLFLRAAPRSRDSARILLILGLAACFAVVRELDALLDELVARGTYKYVAAPIVATAAVVVWRARADLLAESQAYLPTPGASLAFAGGLVVLLYAQIVGQREFWAGVMGDGYMWNVKRMSEEISELLGYLLIFFSSIESYLTARRPAAGG